MLLTLDSSVVVASLVEGEKCHLQCKALMEKLANFEFVAIMPYSVFVEVVAAIRRRTDSEELAERVGKDLKSMDSIFFLEILQFRAEEAADLAMKTGLRGMDAIVAQIAKESNSILITLDGEMAVKSECHVKTNTIENILEELSGK